MPRAACAAPVSIDRPARLSTEMNGPSAAAFSDASSARMAAIYHFNGGLSEGRLVTLVSRAAALALAAAAVALVSLLKIETPDDGLGAPVVTAFLSAPQSPPQHPRVIRPQHHTAEETEAASAAIGEADDWPHLWTYDTQGRIVLRTNEQLARCTNARQQGREEADCPDSNERTPMISRDS